VPQNFQYSVLPRPLAAFVDPQFQFQYSVLAFPVSGTFGCRFGDVWYTADLTTPDMSTKPRSAGRGVTPRVGSTLYTAKHPGRCPNCGSTALSRKGSRRKKFETVQRWLCGSCGRGFTPAPPELRAKTYPVRVILDAVTLYNLGHTLADASAKLKTKSGYRVPRSTLAAWIAEHRDLTTYARLREPGRVLFKPSQVIRTTRLYHRQVYEYAFHQLKLAFLRHDAEHARFANVADFLEAVPTRCPHDLFQGSARASESAPAFLDRSRLSARQKENFATRLAQLVIPSVGDNYRRHETLQRFMLAAVLRILPAYHAR
jgi:hypothetical protein